MEQRLAAREDELQRLLTDERSRCDQHKQMYQTLKEKHNRLQEELVIIHHQLKEAREQNEQFRASKEAYIKKLEETLVEKQDEIKALRDEVELLRSEEHVEKAVAKASKKFQDKIGSLQEEVNKLRTQYNQLHYDHTVLKCESDYVEEEHSRAVDLIKVKHLSEVSELKAKIEALESRETAPVKDYSAELVAAEKEVLQLNSRVKSLLSECEELRAQNERLTVQMDGMARTHSNQLAEHTAAIRTIENEKSSAVMQKEVLQSQLTTLENQKQYLNKELQDAKQEVLHLRSQLEDLKNKYELDTTNLKVEVQQLASDLETEKERMQRIINRLHAEANQLRIDTERKKQIDIEREQNLQRHVLDIKQQAWKKCSEVEQEKEQTELKLKEVEIKSKEEIKLLQMKLKKTEESLKAAVQSKSDVQKEVSLLKSRLQYYEANTKDVKVLENLERQNAEFTKEVQQLREQISHLVAQNVGLSGRDRKNGAQLVYESPGDTKVNSYEEIVQLRLTLEQQKYQYQQRIDGLENHLKEQKITWDNEKKDMQNKLKQYARLITKLRDRLDTQKRRVEELEVQNEILSKNIPLDDHLELKRQFTDLQRKQNEFQEVMRVALPFSVDTSWGLQAPLDRGLHIGGLTMDTIPKVTGEGLTQKSKEFGSPFGERKSENVFDASKDKSPKLSSQTRRRPQRQKSSTKRVADYSSSSDVENL